MFKPLLQVPSKQILKAFHIQNHAIVFKIFYNHIFIEQTIIFVSPEKIIFFQMSYYGAHLPQLIATSPLEFSLVIK